MLPELTQALGRASTRFAAAAGVSSDVHPVSCTCGCRALSGLADLAADPGDLFELAALWRIDAAALATVLAVPSREHDDLASLVAALALAAGRGDAAAPQVSAPRARETSEHDRPSTPERPGRGRPQSRGGGWLRLRAWARTRGRVRAPRVGSDPHPVGVAGAPGA